MEFLIGLTNKNPESDIDENAERSERGSKPPPHLTSLVSLQTIEWVPVFSWLYSYKLFLPWLFDYVLCRLNMQDLQKSDCWILPKQWRWVLQISCFTESSARNSRTVDWMWIPQHIRETFEECPVSYISLSFLESWKLLAMWFLFISVIFFLWSCMELKTR